MNEGSILDWDDESLSNLINNPQKLGLKRNAYEIIANILILAKNGIPPTTASTRVGTNSIQMKRILGKMLDAQLVKKTKVTQGNARFNLTTTEKGLIFLYLYDSLQKLLWIEKEPKIEEKKRSFTSIFHRKK